MRQVWLRGRRRAAQLSAMMLLWLIDQALRRFGYRPVRRMLHRLSPRPSPMRVDVEAARRVGMAVNVLAGRAGLEHSCLRRSLLTWWIMRWQGLDGELRIGLRMSPDAAAHAWLEHHGTPVNDVADVAQRYPMHHDGEMDSRRVKVSA